ncbi:Ti-type conjugative transfer relaxase TraA [Mesorhizobium sp. J18]|jgi:Ti-type conjugative transfer relaxase TraA|uniref:Ti-type conjugative transfer relaxase TraA n=1 Tax=Mesorhizobium sp. J18 TaxID=935263 RepID=UPI0011995ADE|nr:Ti-type conjugative transfer relaxase TraA [Mesorhizobium sp. J18]TWG99369.1 Ti-type conjugative transfer relaxase TraA [Mesorhizobium sp. J18]
MAIYHLHVKVIGRKAGSSAVASAAYRSASRLRDERLDRVQDFSNKRGVVHSEIMLPDGAPEQWSDRERLWNDVEAFEVRKDAQLAREVEFAIPREMTQAQGIELARDFVQSEFVDQGMIADLNVHWDVGEDGMPKPHAHVMLTMRSVDENGFGPKVRDWNRTEMVERWRERWAEHVNERLAELDIDARIDHRSLEAQGIGLEPQTQIGAPAQRIEIDGIEAADRADMHREIARNNGERIIADPSIALDAITHQQSTFTRRDMAMFAHRHSDGIDQFNEVTNAIENAPNLVELGKDGRGEDRFTTHDMIEAEQRLHRAAELMAEKELHEVSDRDREAALARAEQRGLVLSGEQADALAHVTDGRDLGIVVGYAGTGKSAMLGVAKEAWEAAGYEVRGVALSGIAAENLESGSGIASRTIASMEHGWGQGRDMLTSRDVLVIDEAGMVGTRQLERVLSHAAEAGAKVVLVGDPQQLQSIEAGAAFRSIHELHGGVEIETVRRQREDWQRDATRDLATGKIQDAIHAYDAHDMVHEAQTREQARDDLIERWDRDRQASPDATRIILTHTNAEVRELNEAARDRMRDAGDLGEDVRVTVERGERSFAAGDRVMFLQNERGLGVKNGTLGTIEDVSTQSMSVRTDDGRSIAFDLKDYDRIDHGYAATIHKSQGMTVDRTHVLATPGLDAHGSYVALSRHRDGIDLHYGRDDFASQDKLVNTLSRDRAKDMATDYDQQQIDPAQDYAERRGITFRARIAQIMRRLMPERMRDALDDYIDSLRSPGEHVPAGPDREVARREVQRDLEATSRETGIEPEELLRRARSGQSFVRHARAVDAIFAAQERGIAATPEQVQELHEARAGFNELRPHGSHDAEAVYKKNPEFAADVASGDPNRAAPAKRALQLETEMRQNPELRADRFVERFQELKHTSEQQYAAGNYSGHRAARAELGNMVDGLQRDPQLESLLANRKRELGISFDTGMGVGRDLALGLGLGRGRGLDIGM